NIVTNPGFEAAKNNWSWWGTKIKLSTTEKYSGTYGLEMVHGTTGTRTLNNGTTYAVVPGSKVLASAYVKAVGSGTTDAFLELEWRTSGGSILKRDQVAYTGGAIAWTKIEQTLTVPANATKLKIRLKDSATPSVGSVFFDDVSVQLSETVTASERLFSRILSNVLTAVQAVSASR
ncbi:MAG: carbohydrate binding domain-containing protein, partial [Patescibacteria group bacterium]